MDQARAVLSCALEEALGRPNRIDVPIDRREERCGNGTGLDRRSQPRELASRQTAYRKLRAFELCGTRAHDLRLRRITRPVQVSAPDDSEPQPRVQCVVGDEAAKP